MKDDDHFCEKSTMHRDNAAIVAFPKYNIFRKLIYQRVSRHFATKHRHDEKFAA